MKPEDFERLRTHLKPDVYPVFDVFIENHNLVYATHVGPYPRVRAERTRDDGALMWIEFWMALDSQGRYFEEFSAQVPHELSGGVSVDVEEKEGVVRYGSTITMYENRAYCAALKTLEEDLETLWGRIVVLPNDAVFHGRRNVLRR